MTETIEKNPGIKPLPENITVDSQDGSADLIQGGEETDELWPSDGNNSLYGEAGNDSLYGGNGDDLLEGGEGLDHLASGAGDDTFIFDMNDISMDGGSGFDTANIIDETFDFSTLDNMLDHVDSLDLVGSFLTIDSAFVNNVSGQEYTIKVEGDNTSQLTFEEVFADDGITNIGGKIYTIYTNDDTTIHVDTSITVIMP